MVQTNSPNDGEDGHQPINDPQPLSVYRPRRWPMVVTVTTLYAIGGVGIITFILLSRAIPDTAVRYGFVAQNVLSLFVFLAVFAQACVYWGQRNLMKAQWLDMESSLERTDRIIEKMGGQLEAMQKQEGHLLAQAEAAKAQLVAFDRQILLGQTQMQIAGEAMKISRRSADATEEAAKIAREGIQLSQQNMITTQRAYVSVTERRTHQEGFVLKIENTGSTPALDVGVKAVATQGYSRPAIPENDSDCYFSIGLLAPRSSYDLTLDIRDDLSEKKDEVAGMEGFNYWCTGVIWYTDIFRPDIQDAHRTHFCFYQVPAKRPIQAWHEGNDAT